MMKASRRLASLIFAITCHFLSVNLKVTCQLITCHSKADPRANIREVCAEELRLEYENAAVENSKAQDINLPHEIRRISDKDRASSMPKLLEYSEEKTFANIKAFNLAAQQPAGSRTAVRFREITEPVKKSKWFHALYTVVSLDYFKTAMMEIQKQREEEKALEENRPSMATTFEEIKQCRYLRIPDHYQKKDG